MRIKSLKRCSLKYMDLVTWKEVLGSSPRDDPSTSFPRSQPFFLVWSFPACVSVSNGIRSLKQNKSEMTLKAVVMILDYLGEPPLFHRQIKRLQRNHLPTKRISVSSWHLGGPKPNRSPPTVSLSQPHRERGTEREASRD